MNKKIISIVTPSLDHGRFIRETILSVISQSGDFYLDYIIMDGGSTDDTLKIIKDIENLISYNNDSSEIKGLKFYKKKGILVNCLGISFRWFSNKDLGQVHAINEGFKIAVGEIFGWLNSDDVYYPNVLNIIANLDWENFDFSYGKAKWINIKGDIISSYYTVNPNKYNLFCQCILSQPTVFFKKTTFEKIGELDNTFNIIFDYEYWLRAISANLRFKYLKTFIAKSRMYKTNKSLRYLDNNFNNLEIQKLRDKYSFLKNDLNPLTFFFVKMYIDILIFLKKRILFKNL